MSLISDVKTEIKNLDLSKKNLRNFGLLIGGIFILISIVLFLKTSGHIFFYFLLILGSSLVILGVIFPLTLKHIYKSWMGLAFTMGWIVSGILMIVLFYFMVTPIGLIAKLTGKQFLNLKFPEKKSTYWINKSGDIKIDYRKMY